MTRADSRRTLDFRDWDALLADVQALQASTCRGLKSWDLGRTCVHLALPIHGCLDGGIPPANWWLRTFIGPIAKRRVLSSRRLPDGVNAPPPMLPPQSIDAGPAVEQLRQAVARFEAHDGPTGSHPFFGRLSKPQWKQFHLIHAEHHLSWLIPTNRP